MAAIDTIIYDNMDIKILDINYTPAEVSKH